MYDLLIVEDEEIILKALTVIIDWNAIGFQVAGTAGCAADALRILEESNMDVVLTDIKMPVVSGLELACELKSRFPAIRTILLSAFREFEFAQKAIEYGVHGYLLKTSGKEEIRKYFIKLKEELDLERARVSFYGGQGRAGAGPWWADSRRLLQKLLTGCDASNPELQVEEAARLGINLRHPGFTVALFELDRANEITALSGEEGLRAITAFIRNLVYLAVEIRQNGYVTELDGRTCALLTMKEAQASTFLRQLYQDIADELEISQFGRNTDVTISAAVGRAAASPQEIALSHASAAGCLAGKITLGCGKLSFAQDGQHINASSGDGLWMKADTDRIEALVRERKFTEAVARLDRAEARLIEQGAVSLDEPILCCVGILRQALDASPGPLPFRGVLMDLAQCEKMIGAADTVASLFDETRELLYGLEERSQPAPPAGTGPVVSKALGYLRERYATDLRLEDMASHVNVHPVHLCRLFSHETGMTFKELLTQERVNRAKELLADPSLKVYEISLAVGYRKPRYFSDLFRKVTGMTPLEYRERA